MVTRAVMADVSLARRLTLFDATMIVMGGIVGAGIFMNPAVVAQEVGSAGAALGAWAVSTPTCARRFTRSWRSSTHGLCSWYRRVAGWLPWQ